MRRIYGVRLLLWSSHAVELLYHHAVVQNASCAMYAAAPRYFPSPDELGQNRFALFASVVTLAGLQLHKAFWQLAMQK